MNPFKTNRGLAKYFFFSLLSFGIYGIVVITNVVNEVNTFLTKYDRRHTMHFCILTFLVNPITLGIAQLFWWHNLCDRIGNELFKRNSCVVFNSDSFWGWCFFGSLLFGVGPLIFMYKFFRATNALNEFYNIENVELR